MQLHSFLKPNTLHRKKIPPGEIPGGGPWTGDELQQMLRSWMYSAVSLAPFLPSVVCGGRGWGVRGWRSFPFRRPQGLVSLWSVDQSWWGPESVFETRSPPTHPLRLAVCPEEAGTELSIFSWGRNYLLVRSSNPSKVTRAQRHLGEHVQGNTPRTGWSMLAKSGRSFHTK